MLPGLHPQRSRGQRGSLPLTQIFVFSCQIVLSIPNTPFDPYGSVPTPIQVQLCLHTSRFLKEYILPHLQGNHEITMSYTHKAADPNAATTKKARLAASRHNWSWKVIPPEERPIPPAPPKAKNVVGTEVGVGEDVSHLNRRRTRARVAKVSKQVKHMKNYKAYAAERDSLLSKIEKNPYTLKKVSKALHDNPDADVSYLSVSEEIARQNLPKQFWQDQPIEGEKAQTRLKHIRKHLAWRQPDILNR